jgi:hypothetical protein
VSESHGTWGSLVSPSLTPPGPEACYACRMTTRTELHMTVGPANTHAELLDEAEAQARAFYGHDLIQVDSFVADEYDKVRTVGSDAAFTTYTADVVYVPCPAEVPTPATTTPLAPGFVR